jgi:hypothetical protein
MARGEGKPAVIFRPMHQGGTLLRLTRGSAPMAECLHCKNPFNRGEGVITEDAAICDVCLG